MVRRPDAYPGAKTEMRIAAIALHLGAVAIGIIAAGLLSIFLWHLRGWRRGLVFLMPTLGCGIAMVAFTADPMTAWIRGWGQVRIGTAYGLEIIGIAIGLAIGRPVIRFFLRLFLPPRVRQHFAFLWIVDGKKMKLESIGPAITSFSGETPKNE